MCVQRPQFQHLARFIIGGKRWNSQCAAILLLCALVLGGCAGAGVTVHFAINTTTIPDAIAGRSYTAHVATSSSVATDSVTACALTGTFPAGMTAAPGTVAGAASYCVLTMASAPAAAKYSFTLNATDQSTPAKTASQSYSITVHPEFTYSTSSLAPGVQGRTYGVSPLAQTESTNIGSTVGGITVGNGPLTACTVLATPSNPGLAAAVDSTGTKCVLTSNSLTPAGSYSVTVTATETSIPDPVSSGVAVPGTPGVNNNLTLVVNPEITFSLNFDSAPGSSVGVVPDAVQGRTYGAPARTSLVLTAQGGLMATQGLIISGSGAVPLPVDCVVSPAASPALTPGTPPETPSGTAVVSATNITVTCAGGAVTSTPGAVAFATSVKDLGNAATPPNTIAADLSGHTSHTLTVDAPLALSVDAASAPVNPAPPGAVGRSYGNTAAGLKDLAFDAANGLGSYVFGLPASVASPGTGVPSSIACTANGATAACTSGASPVTGGAGAYTFSVTLNDAANATTPSASASSTTPAAITGSLQINPAPSIQLTQAGNAASPNPANLLPSVTNRSYGVIGAPPTYTVSGGSGTYTFPASPGPFPAGFVCTATSNTYTCSANPVSAAANAYPINLTVTDTGDAAMPNGTATSTSTLVVNTAMSVTPPATVPTAVHGRAYGTGTGCSGGGGNCAPLQYFLSNGLGTYTLTGSSLATPSDTFACTFTSPTFSCSKSAIAGAGGANPTLTFIGSETGNAATPGGSATDTSKALATNAEMTVTLPSTVPPAVLGRHYGSGSGCSGGNCAPLTYTVPAATPGLGGYTFAPNNFPAGFSCATSSNNGNCQAIAVGGSAGTLTTLTVTVTDTANSSVPNNSTTSSATSLTVEPEMNFTATPTSPFADAVTGRTYGQGSTCGASGTFACAPLTYTVQAGSGLGGYSFALSVNGSGGGFGCTGGGTSSNCTSGGITQAAGTYTSVHASVTDAANASVPSNTIPSTNGTLTVHPEMTVTPPIAVVTAVHGRAYGTGAGCSSGACQSLQYSLSNGLGNYTATGSSLTAGSDTFTLSFTSPTYAFSKLVISGVGGTAPALTFTGAETGNAATPAHSVTDTSKFLAINAALAISVSIGGVGYPEEASWPVGVLGRPYGSGNGCAGDAACAPAIYTVSNGLPGTYTFSNFASLTGAGFTCNQSSPTLTCSATNLASGFTPSVTASDTPNASTPAATTTSDPTSILTGTIVTVNPELYILNLFLENAVVGEPYSATLDSNRLGIGPPYVWCAGTISNGVCTNSGGIAGVSFGTPALLPVDDPSANIRGYYFGTPTTGGAPATSIKMADLGNATTPSCSYIGTCPTLALSGASAPKVFAADGFVATYASNSGEQGDTLFSFGTSSPFTSPFNLKLDTNGFPVTPRVAPDGNWVYVTEQGSHQVAVVDPTAGTRVRSITVSNTGTVASNPTGLDIEPQRFFTANPNGCASNCSNLNPFIRYDAYVTDPTDGSQTTATVEPLPDAENPGALPATLASANRLTVADANNIALSTDGTQAFVSLNYEPSGSQCASLPALCNTFAVLGLPVLSAPASTNYTPFTTQTPATFDTFGLRAGPVAGDPRGLFVTTATTDSTGTYNYLTVTSTGATPAFVTYIPTAAGPTHTVNVCSASGVVFTPVSAVPTALVTSPDGNRLFVACQDTATPQVNNTVGVWDISGTHMGVPFIQSIALPASSGAPVVNAENGCTTPLDVKAKLTDDSTTSTYGTRLFVSCQDSDTVVLIDYNTTTDAANIYASVVSTDGSPITNATLGNTTAAYIYYACGNTGSCPQFLDLMPNPAIHFTTGGYAPTLPFALPAASIAAGSYQYFLVAQGGAVPRTFTETTATPLLVGATGVGACQGLSLASSGLISGTPTNTGTCGPFTIRVTGGSTPGQFVERRFTITVNP